MRFNKHQPAHLQIIWASPKSRPPHVHPLLSKLLAESQVFLIRAADGCRALPVTEVHPHGTVHRLHLGCGRCEVKGYQGVQPGMGGDANGSLEDAKLDSNGWALHHSASLRRLTGTG